MSPKNTTRTLVATLAILSHAYLASGAAAQASPPEPVGAAGDYAADMSLPSAEQAMKEVSSRIAPRIHLFHAPLGFGPAPLANEMLIEQSDGLVLVDAGKTRGAGQRIVALIRAISAKPVKAVIITHWHQDHVMGLGPIVEAWPSATIIASAATRDHLRTEVSYRDAPRTPGATAARDSSRAAALAQYAVQYGPQLRDQTLSAEEHRGWAEVVGVLKLRIADEQGSYLVLPTVTFTDRYQIDDPVAPVEAIFLGPAHTDGDIVAWAPKQRVVAAGDMMVAPIPYGGTNVLDWPTTLEHLKALHPRVIVPGHGPAEFDGRYLDRLIAAFSEVDAKARLLGDTPKLTDDEVVAKIDLAKTRTLFAGDNRWLAYWFDQYFAPNAAVAYTELRTPKAP